MDDLQVYVRFNSISVISEGELVDYERLCVKEITGIPGVTAPDGHVSRLVDKGKREIVVCYGINLIY